MCGTVIDAMPYIMYTRNLSSEFEQEPIYQMPSSHLEKPQILSSSFLVQRKYPLREWKQNAGKWTQVWIHLVECLLVCDTM